MTFLGIIGAPRKGKTLLAVILLTQIYKQNKLNNTPFYGFANFHFLNEMSKVVQYIDNPQSYMGVTTPELGQGLAIFDELWAWLASRGSGTNVVNKFTQQIVFQSGKRGFDTIWTAQLSSSVDKIVRKLTNKFFKTREPTEDYFRYNYVSSTYYEGRKVMPLRIPKTIASQYYKYYDTREIIKTLTAEDLEKEPTELSPLSGIAEVDDNLSPEDEKEINTIEQNLSQTQKPIQTVDERIDERLNDDKLEQQNQEEHDTKRKVIQLDLGLR